MFRVGFALSGVEMAQRHCSIQVESLWWIAERAVVEEKQVQRSARWTSIQAPLSRLVPRELVRLD